MSANPSRLPTPSFNHSTPKSIQSGIPRRPSPPKVPSATIAVGQAIHMPATPAPFSQLATPMTRPVYGCKQSGNSKTTPRKTVNPGSSSTNTSRYVSVHMGEPCTVDSLDHLLMCGHKVCTSQPEDCASNCHKTTSEYANPRRVDEPFVCIVCITQQIKREHADRVAAFRHELGRVCEMTKKPSGWIDEKVSFMSMAWRDQDIDRTMARIEEGRLCHAIYVEEEYTELAGQAYKARKREGRPREREGAQRRAPSPVPATPITSKVANTTPAAPKQSKLPRRSPSPPVSRSRSPDPELTTYLTERSKVSLLKR